MELTEIVRRGCYQKLVTLLAKGGHNVDDISKVFVFAAVSDQQMCVKPLYFYQQHDREYVVDAACGTKNQKIRTFLLIRNRDWLIRDSDFLNRVLSRVISDGQDKLLCELIAAGLDVNFVLLDGRSLLQSISLTTTWAIRSRLTQLVLCVIGVNPHQKDPNGKTAYDCMTSDYKTIIDNFSEFLEKYNDWEWRKSKDLYWYDLARVKLMMRTATDEWYKNVGDEYKLINGYYCDTYLAKLPRELIHCYIMPYLGAKPLLGS